MDGSTVASGWHAAWHDIRAFVDAIQFTRPQAWYLLPLPALLLLLTTAARRWSRSQANQLGTSVGLGWLLTRRSRSARYLPIVATLILIVGLAGPAWGEGDDPGTVIGRDVVVVLDLSRSMLAEDMTNPPARWQAAIEGIVELLQSLQRRGGSRVGVVIFASRAVAWIPLTADLDYVTARVRDLDATTPPPAIRPEDDSVSGTRIGAAILAGVAMHDTRFPGAQDLILFSDGDDPARDRDWVAGVSKAREAGIPVHVVGVGDPTRDSTLTLDGRLLEAIGPNGVPDPIQTRLNEALLREMAREGRGVYIPAHRDLPRMNEFVREHLARQGTRELLDDALPQPRDRSSWFLAASLVLWGLWLFRSGGE